MSVFYYIRQFNGEEGDLTTFLSDGLFLFGWKIQYYSLLVVIGAFAATFVATHEIKRINLDPMLLWDVLPWVLIFGLIGARIWHVLTPSISLLDNGKNPYFENPLLIFSLKKGGLGIPGGIIAGAIVIWFFTRRRHLSFLSFGDTCVAGVALGQAIGRWGNYFNQELYGFPTTATEFPFAIYIEPAHRLGNFSGEAYYLPLFFYEFVWNLFNMFLLLWLPRKLGDKMKEGDNILIFVLTYSIGRFFLEFIRLEYSPIAGININQLFMVITGLFSIVALVIKHIKKPIRSMSDI